MGGVVLKTLGVRVLDDGGLLGEPQSQTLLGLGRFGVFGAT